MEKTTVLFLCTGNAARSQMAEGLANALLEDKVQAFSAGSAPTGRLSSRAIAVMQEIGIDISGRRSKHVDEFQGRQFDYVITLCDSARAACPFFPARIKNLHFGLPDPGAATGERNQTLVIFRQIRDQIRAMILERFS